MTLTSPAASARAAASGPAGAALPGPTARTDAGASAGRAVLKPGGFSRYEGAVVPAARRLAALVGVFLRDLTRGLLAKAAFAAFFAPAAGLSIYVLARAKIEQITVKAPEQTAFLFTNLGWLLTALHAWLLLLLAGKVAAVIARDAASGALLLYFSRPVERGHYGLARWGAAASLCAGALLVPFTLLLAAHALFLGTELGGTTLVGWKAPLLWLGTFVAGAVATVIAAGAASLVALAAGVIARGPGTAPLVFGGTILGSVAVSWVLQRAWGRDSAARALDLHHALGSFFVLLSAPFQPESLPRAARLDALFGAALWVALAAGAWTLLQRFLAAPPLGRSRSA
ncbi:MAG: hypothetical protein EXR79_07270 [Myxococcales bacterium]|nr:hypothetical protein [Myxococcales bacterium]